MRKLNFTKRQAGPEIFLFLLIAILGLMFVRYTWIRIENEKAIEVLKIARSVGAILPKEDLKVLEAEPRDLDKPQYQVIKNMLKAIISFNADARFAYLYAEKNGKIYFLADSEPADSKDYSPPGQEYTEAKAEDKQPFKDGKERITAPLSDRWGTWISVFIPIKDEATGKIIAVFGMDFNAKAWQNAILFGIIESSVLILLILLAFLFLFKLKANNRSLKFEITERTQAEEALLASENQKAAILKVIPDLLFVFDSNGNYKDIYTEDDSKLLLSRETLIGKNIGDFFPSDVAEGAIEAFRKSLHGKELVQYTYPVFINGKSEYYEARIVPTHRNDLLVIVRDITEHKQAQDALSQGQERAREQCNAIARIAVDEVISFGDLKDSFQRLTEEITAAIRVMRASIWLLSDDKTELQCISLFDNETKKHSSGAILNYKNYPRYFEAINRESRINAGDAQNNPSTSEFTEGYLTPVGITSMLDAGIYVESELVGVVCIEHTGEKRTWHSDEESFAGTMASIVAQVLANNKRKQAERIVQDIIAENPISIQILDKEGFTLQINSAHTALFGAVPPADYSIFTDFQLLKQGCGEFIERAKKGEVVRFPDLYYNVHDTFPEFPDVPVWLQTVAFPLNDSNGKPERFVLMHENITWRKQAEESLELARQSYLDIFNSVSEAIYVQDETSAFIDVNKGAEKIYGYSHEELIGQSPLTVAAPGRNNLEETQRISLNVFETGIPSRFDFWAVRKNGEIFPKEVIVNKGMYFGKEVLIATARDMTESKKAEQELIAAKEKAEESDRLKSAFLANMSHEIRTPMNGIMGFAGLMKQPNLSVEEQQNYIRIIEKSGARLLNIINDLVNISKIESGQMEVTVSDTNINEQIEYIYTFFKPEVEQKGIQLLFKSSLPAKESIIKTDREKVYAILTNLVKNAIKFTQAGSIEFGYKLIPVEADNNLAKPAVLEFFVKDTGSGVRQEQKEIIFDRFIQGSESLTRDYEGAGLGLSITKAYVEMLGGSIWVESELGKGSAFYFTLPYNVGWEAKNVVKSVALSEGTEDHNNHEGLGIKILIAEDDEISELFITKIVGIYSKETLIVRTGIEAVETCRNNPDIDLILMDIKMPGLDGLEATRQIREFNKHVIIIAQTAFGLTGDKELAIEAGCNDYLAKPLDLASLRGLIQKHFKK